MVTPSSVGREGVGVDFSDCEVAARSPQAQGFELIWLFLSLAHLISQGF